MTTSTSAGPPPGRSADTPARILDATMTALAAHGLAGLSLEAVAREAGLSRQTVYRWFGSREALLSAAILREEQAFIERITQAAAEHADLVGALTAAIAAGLQAAREHPLLDRLLATEPEALLPFLTTGAGPVLSAARPVLEALLAERLPGVSPEVVQGAADALSRLVISYAVNPPERPVPEVAGGLARLIVEGLGAHATGSCGSP